MTTEPLRPTRRFVVIGIDPSSGRSKDSCGIAVLRSGSRVRGGFTSTCERLESAKLSFADQEKVAKNLLKHYDDTEEEGVGLVLALDSTGIGQATAEALDLAIRQAYEDGVLSRKVHFIGISIQGGERGIPKRVPGAGFVYSVGRGPACVNLVSDIGRGLCDLKSLPRGAREAFAKQAEGWKANGRNDRVDHQSGKGGGSNDDMLWALAVAGIGMKIAVGSQALVNKPPSGVDFGG